MKKLVRSRAGCRTPRPLISIRVRPMEMSKCPASSNTVQCGRPGSTGTSSVDVSQSGSVKSRTTAAIRASSPASVSTVVCMNPWPGHLFVLARILPGQRAGLDIIRMPG